MDEALVPSTQRLRIERSNFRLPSDIQSKESTLQLVYDVLRRCPFFKAFLMNNKKHIVSLESFREMLHIFPRIHGQSFDELPFEEEILDFIRNIDYAFLIWEDFVYQVEHKNRKKSNEMYYPRFTKVIIHHFMSKGPSIPRRKKINWHYVMDDFIFSTIKVVSRHQNTQQYGAMLPIELMNDEIRNTKAYKEYYAFATREAAPKLKASARGKRSGKQLAKSLSTPLEVARTEAQQLKIVLRRSRQQTYISQPGGSGTDERTDSKPWVPDVPTDESKDELSWNSSDDEGADDQEKVGDDNEGDEGNDREEREEDDDEEEKDGDERDDDKDQEITKDDE
nr:hypothetical protein [Tanacetum cinerariifolium]